MIVAADRLNATAANRFLKTLEEPPADSVLVLLSTAPEQVLETLRSRCQRPTLFDLSDPAGVRTRVGMVASLWGRGGKRFRRTPGALPTPFGSAEAPLGPQKSGGRTAHRGLAFGEGEGFGA
jgi:hypothetical protein